MNLFTQKIVITSEKFMHYALLFLFISFANSHDYVNENTDNQIIKQSNDESLYLGTHLATGACSYVTSLSVILLSLVVGEIIAKKNISEYKDVNLMSSALPPLIGIITGAWIFYKSPQWTDTYIIKKKDTRTFTQNMATFLSRIVWNYPLGVILGEICNDNFKPETNV